MNPNPQSNFKFIWKISLISAIGGFLRDAL